MPARAVKEFLSKKHVKDLVVQGELETLRTSSTVYDALHVRTVTVMMHDMSRRRDHIKNSRP